MDKSYRIHTDILNDKILNVNMKQDFDFLEVLTMKLAQKDAYKIHSSNYGVIVGRVLANDAFGIPNAKVSVFIEKDGTDTTEIENLYPYSEVTTKDKNSRRYNLLPDYSDDECYRIVGTFPNKRLLLDEDNYLEIYDKYWKFSTVTNNAGDYMIFGVPVGSQTIHTDIDLSDIGILSQKPRDFLYKGYNINEFDNANQFKASTNLDSLKQIVSQNKSTYVYPFWGDADNGIAAITRCDIDVDYKFEPTCIFMGAIVSDNEANAIGHKCAPEVDNGMNNQLIAGEGTIEMIRKTTDGLVEEYPIQGNRLIDSDGVWCYQIPMNLDYIGTDEYGNIVPTDNPNRGIPTRTQVRFRFSKTDTGEEGHSRHTAKYLVPMNPLFYEGDKTGDDKEKEEVVIPKSAASGQDYENMYTFGSNTPISCFRDLYWNNVYSVKNYIPKTQVAHRPYSTNYSALKGSNLVDDQNPIPFNKLRVDLPFMYMIVCIIFTIVMWVVTVINVVISIIHWMISHICLYIYVFWLDLSWCPLETLLDIFGLDFTCIGLGAGVSEDNTAYYPGCFDGALDESSCPDEMDNCEKSTSQTDLMDNIQRKLALDFKIIKLDLYQDWINGCLYMPLWYWRKRKKKTFLFGLFSRSAVNTFCSCNNSYSRLKTSVTCDIAAEDISFKTSQDTVLGDEDRWHKARSASVRYLNGLIKPVNNKDGLTAYYYAAMQPTTDNVQKKITDYQENEFNVIRLYATDIILLGNINEDNIYGLPQFFKVLPSTTANIPPIATIEENPTDVKNDTATQFDALGGEDSGTSITTGMDWGDKGGDATPAYKNGLFFDLGCTTVLTKAKSCINVERLSELGVNLDMQYDYTYTRGGDIKMDKIDSDGFITKYELDDMNNRSMFATLNHIGFVPQQYLDTIDGNNLTTQVEDENTNYYVPKFRYIFPVDFDGRMQPIMDSYGKGFAQALYDDPDEAYITFRMGADENGKYGRKRHFYKHEDGNWHMPVYNNSFYFYFGINKGSTAIDKFNNLYMADCFQNVKDPFSLNIAVRPKSYCPSMYKCDKKQGYGQITVESEDIQVPYAYALYDSYGQIVKSVDGLTTASNNKVSEPEFTIGMDEFELTNQKYKLVVTDDNGKTLKRSIEMEMPKISFTYDSYRLGTKFYTTRTTRMDNICNQENDYFGRFVISNITIDGYDTVIKHSNGSIDDIIIEYDEESDQYKVRFSVETVDVCKKEEYANKPIFESDMIMTISILKSEYKGKLRDCMCDLGNNMDTKGELGPADGYVDYLPNVLTLKNISESTSSEDKPIWALEFDVFQPNSFSVSLSQICNIDGEDVIITGNTANEIVTVNNGENFNAYLNSMPVLFMLGTNTDNVNMDVANQSYFYTSKYVATDARDKSIIGWYGVHQEDSYQFSRASLMTLEENQPIWEDFLKFNDSFLSPLSKLKILQYKFSRMFTLSANIYDIENSSRLTYMTTGGVQPILIRNVSPDYDEGGGTQYYFNDINYVDVPKDKPNITYDNVVDGVPVFSREFHDRYRSKLGNYFSAFSNNGGYRNRTTLDTGMASARIPNFSSVSPMGISQPKPIGKKAKGTIEAFPYVYQSGKQQLDNDKSRDVRPYLRALTVDRRFDYDLIMFGPVHADFNLYAVNEEEQNVGEFVPQDKDRPKPYVDRNRGWRNGRIVGRIYGGIEMSYDDDYNIITADTTYNKTTTKNAEGVVTEIDDYSLPPIEATPNTLLEYTYEFTSNDTDAKTTYNMPDPNNVVWERDGVNVIDVDTSAVTRQYGVEITDTSAVRDDGLVPSTAVTVSNPTPSINRKFYEFDYAGVDLRDYVWSYNNEERLKSYITNEQNNNIIGLNAFYNCKNNPYVFSYPSFNRTDFNGNFDRESVKEGGNYPTRRFIDVGNIEQSSLYDFYLSSCAYSNTINIKNGEIIGKTKERVAGAIDVTCSMDESPVIFLQSEANNNNEGNVVYKKKDTKDINGLTYHNFEAQRLSLVFSLTPKTVSGFKVYTYLPAIIQVLPMIVSETTGEAVDGITYLKTIAPEAGRARRRYTPELFGIGNVYNVQYPWTDEVKPVLLYFFNGGGWWIWDSGWPGHIGYDALLPDNCVYRNNFDDYDHNHESNAVIKHTHDTPILTKLLYNESDSKYLSSDAPEFASVIFIKELDLHDGHNGDVKAAAIEVTREYVSNTKDGRLKRISTIEFSEMIDCRDIYLRIDRDKTKIRYRKAVGTANVHVEGDTEPQTQSSQNAGTRADNEQDPQHVSADGTGETESSLYSQTIGFEFCITSDDDPVKSSCQIFNSKNIGYTFIFEKSTDTSMTYAIDSSTIDAIPFEDSATVKGARISVPISLTQEMGLIYENKWNCYALISTGTLKYMVGRFGLKGDAPSPMPDESTVEVDSNVTIIDPYPTSN